jgi:hypothetical protein
VYRPTLPQGHGSRFIEGTAVSKLMGVVTKALEFRRQQELALGWDCAAGCKHAQVQPPLVWRFWTF